ncbi:MAG: nucleoside kinase [Bacteroidales bacterium]|nr:nucleoside kinase [Bacteroidales bacterium]
MNNTEQIEIVISNTGLRQHITPGTHLAELAAAYTRETAGQSGKPQLPILGALVNNRVESLQYRVYTPKVIRFLNITDRQGFRMYRNALCFMLYKAVHDCYPKAVLSIDHSLQNGFYCRIESAVEDFQLPEQLEVCRAVRDRMIALQEADMPFVNRTMLLSDAIDLISPRHMPKTVELLQNLKQLYIEMNFLGDTVHKMSGKLAPSTGCITCWDFRTFEEGYILQCADTDHPDKLSLFQPTPKLFAIFREHHHWVDLLHTSTVSDYNRIVHDKGPQHLIHLAEALHEKKYAEIADMVRQSGARLVLLAGPSSSGKTTSCRRLSVQLSVLGYDVQQISLDDYFVCRARTPKLPNGEFDFESIDALDIPLLNEHLLALARGEEVKIPTFDFIKGDPYYSGKTLKMGPRSILVIEGIHALNPKLTAQIDDSFKFKIYVSALTQLAIDNQNIIHGTDNRLVRRLVRDNNFRGWGALDTLHRWPEVVRGEREHIFPFQENANVMFNSALLYELGVLKVYAEPLLKEVPENCEEYSIARQLLDFSELITPIEAKYIPYNSIMREFLGGSSFEY